MAQMDRVNLLVQINLIWKKYGSNFLYFIQSYEFVFINTPVQCEIEINQSVLCEYISPLKSLP